MPRGAQVHVASKASKDPKVTLATVVQRAHVAAVLLVLRVLRGSRAQRENVVRLGLVQVVLLGRWVQRVSVVRWESKDPRATLVLQVHKALEAAMVSRATRVPLGLWVGLDCVDLKVTVACKVPRVTLVSKVPRETKVM